MIHSMLVLVYQDETNTYMINNEFFKCIMQYACIINVYWQRI